MLGEEHERPLGPAAVGEEDADEAAVRRALAHEERAPGELAEAAGLELGAAPRERDEGLAQLAARARLEVDRGPTGRARDGERKREQWRRDRALPQPAGAQRGDLAVRRHARERDGEPEEEGDRERVRAHHEEHAGGHVREVARSGAELEQATRVAQQVAREVEQRHRAEAEARVHRDLAPERDPQRPREPHARILGRSACEGRAAEDPAAGRRRGATR